MNTNESWSAGDKNPWFRFVVGGFLLWTLLLSITTLSIQHSSSPMIHWGGISRPEHCQPNGTDTKCPDLPKKTGDAREKKPPKPDPNPNSDVIGVVVGVASVVGFLMLAPGAPVALIAGVGIMTWLVVRSTLSK